MPRSPITSGVILAAVAAVAFGVTTPIIAWCGRTVGPLTTASLLYLGAALVALARLRFTPGGDANVRRSDVPRLVAIAVAGGAVAPRSP